MADNPKADFYLRHRRDIEEWSSLRAEAAAELDPLLWGAHEILAAEEGLPAPSQVEKLFYVDRGLELPMSEVGPVNAICYWLPGQLFRRGADYPWPLLAIRTPGRNWAHYQSIKAATEAVAATHGLKIHGNQFVWKGFLELADGETDLDSFRVLAMSRLAAVWRDVEPVVSRTLQHET